MKLAFAACVLSLASIPAHAEWLSREFINADAPVEGIEQFLNDECRPSTLEGIRMFGVQNGHADALHIHIYCRHDNASRRRYKVTLAQFPRAKFDDVVQRLLANPNVHFGPFYFGKTDSPTGMDGLVVIEKIK
jgi:hypothetical protein